MRTSFLSKKNCPQLFRRGVPQLANEMKVVFQSSQQIVSPETDKSARGEGPRSILRVPSLVSSAGTVETVVSKDGADMKDETKEDSKEEEARPPRMAYTSNRGRRSSIAASVGYRPDVMPESWAYNYPESLPDGGRSVQTSRSIPYSPVRVRSSRGSAAMGRPPSTQSSQTQPRRSSFPMSNRGRVSGRGIGRAMSAPRRTSFAPSVSPMRSSGEVAPVRLNKRKLPMAASKTGEQEKQIADV